MMDGQLYESWDLYNIGVWRSGQELDSASMVALGKSIPSIRSFWSKGNMDIN